MRLLSDRLLFAAALLFPTFAIANTEIIGSRSISGNVVVSSGVTASSATIETVEVSSKVVWADGSISTTAANGAGGGVGDAVLAATQTFTGHNEFSGGITVTTITVNGSGGGVGTFLEGTEPAGVADNTVIWADSIDRWLKFIPNGTTDYQVVGSSSSPTAGNLAVWSSSRTLVDGGAPGSGSGVTDFQVDLDTGVIDGTTLSYERLNSTVAATSKNQTWTQPQTFASSTTANTYILVSASESVPAINVQAAGGYGNTAGTSGGLLVNCTNAGTNQGMCGQFYTNAGAQTAIAGVLNVIADNTAFNEPTIYIKNDGTSGGAAGIRIDSPAPQMEWVETDQVSPAGKYETGVNGDGFYIARRNSADNAFEEYIRSFGKAVSGGNYTRFNSTHTLRFYDGDDSNFVSIRSPDTVASNVNFQIPSADGSAGDVLHTSGAGALYLSSKDTFKSSFSYTFRPEVARSTETTNFCSIVNSTNSFTALIACDASTREDGAWFTTLNQYQGGALNVAIQYSMTSATSGDVVFSAKIMCVTPGDSQDVDTDSFASPVNGTDTVPGTAGFLDSVTITPTDDSCAEGDLVILNIAREADLAGDTAAGDSEIRSIRLYE